MAEEEEENRMDEVDTSTYLKDGAAVPTLEFLYLKQAAVEEAHTHAQVRGNSRGAYYYTARSPFFPFSFPRI